jgi:NADH dehydrogenase (ubiquinone) 1 alpha subcomplex subunit 2
VLSKYYPALKKNNPNIPILIREATAVPPTVYARFEYGKEARIVLTKDQSAGDVEKAIRELIENNK